MPWTSMKNTVTAGFLGIRQRLANVRRCADILATYAHDDVAFAEALASGFAARIDIGHDDTFGIVVQVILIPGLGADNNQGNSGGPTPL